MKNATVYALCVAALATAAIAIAGCAVTVADDAPAAVVEQAALVAPQPSPMSIPF